MAEECAIVEEEYLVYAELVDNTDPNIFNHAETSFKSFALDSDQPILTIGGQAFVGKYKDTVGTAVFLEEIPPGTEEQIGFGNEPSDPLFVDIPLRKLQYACHTQKSLEMSRVLLLEKKKQVHDLESPDDRDNSGEVTLDADGLDNDKIDSAIKPRDEPKCISVISDEMELENVLPCVEESEMVKNVEKMKINSNSDV